MKSKAGNMTRWIPIAIVAASSLCCLMLPAAHAHDFRQGAITIAHPFIRIDTSCDDPTTRAYVMLLINQGKQPDRLIAAELDGGRRGKLFAVSKQQPTSLQLVDAIALPAGAETALMPPAYAIEFPLPSKGLQQGAAMTGTLKFERAGIARISFMVEAVNTGKACRVAPPAAMPESMHGHKHR